MGILREPGPRQYQRTLRQTLVGKLQTARREDLISWETCQKGRVPAQERRGGREEVVGGGD